MVEEHLHNLLQVNKATTIHLLQLGVGDLLRPDSLEKVLSCGILGHIQYRACQSEFLN